MTFGTRRAVRALLAALGFAVLVLSVRTATDIPRGLRGDYFSNADRSGTPTFSQLDPEISTARLASAWRADVPTAFSVRWRGYLAVGRAGTYEFATTSDEGSVLTIDGTVVVDNGGRHAAVTRSGTVALDAGPHAVMLEYEQSGGAYALEWMWGRGGQPLGPVAGWLLSPGRISYWRAAGVRALDWLWWIAVALVAIAAAAAVGRAAWQAMASHVRRPAVASLLLFVALAIVQTWPLATDPAHLSRNDNSDTMYCEWAVAWVAHQAPREPLHLFDANIFYPERNTLAYSETLIVQGLMGAPLLWLGASPVLTYNLLLIAGYVLTGWAMTLVLARWTGDWIAALAGGITIGFSAHTVARMPHLQAQHAEFLPLALLALDRLLERPRIRYAWSLAGWFALQALASFYLFVMTAIALVVGTVARPESWWGRRGGRAAVTLAAAAAIAAAMLLPFLLPYYWHASRQPGFTRPLSEAAIFAASWRDYLTSPGRIPRWLFGRSMSFTALYPGGVALALAGVAMASGAAFRDPRARMCLAFGICGVVLSFGPKVPGYALLYNVVPVLRGVRAVSRFGYLALVAVAVLAAFGLARLRTWMRAARWGPIASGAVLILVAVEPLAAPIWYSAYEGIPRIYDRLPQQARVIVAEMPMPYSRQVFFNAPYELNSTAHWQTLVNGYSGFVPPSYNEHVEAVKDFPAPAAIDALRRLGVTFVFVHLDQLPPQAVAALVNAPGLEPLAQQSMVVLYRLADVR